MSRGTANGLGCVGFRDGVRSEIKGQSHISGGQLCASVYPLACPTNRAYMPLKRDDGCVEMRADLVHEKNERAEDKEARRNSIYIYNIIIKK